MYTGAVLLWTRGGWKKEQMLYLQWGIRNTRDVIFSIMHLARADVSLPHLSNGGTNED